MTCPDCGGAGQVLVDIVVGRDVVDRRGTWTVVEVTEPGVDACRRCARAAEAEYQSKISPVENQGGVAA